MPGQMGTLSNITEYICTDDVNIYINWIESLMGKYNPRAETYFLSLDLFYRIHALYDEKTRLLLASVCVLISTPMGLEYKELLLIILLSYLEVFIHMTRREYEVETNVIRTDNLYTYAPSLNILRKTLFLVRNCQEYQINISFTTELISTETIQEREHRRDKNVRYNRFI